MIVWVFEIPSKAYSYGSFATELSDASKPFFSAPYEGFAPGESGSPAFLPSGRDAVALPYTTFDVIVRIDVVGSEFLYVWHFLTLPINVLSSLTAISSARSSSLPYLGKSPVVSKL